VTVAGFIASQRTEFGVPHAVACRALEVSESWFYKWNDRPPTERDRRRAELDAAVKKFFDRSGGTYGSPRIFDDLVEAGWKVSENSVAASMVRQGLVARPKRRRKNLTRPDKKARRHRIAGRVRSI
jgi:putative transposase